MAFDCIRSVSFRQNMCREYIWIFTALTEYIGHFADPRKKGNAIAIRKRLALNFQQIFCQFYAKICEWKILIICYATIIEKSDRKIEFLTKKQETNALGGRKISLCETGF